MSSATPAAAGVPSATLLAILYRFEGTEERRLIRTTLDNLSSISADKLLGLLRDDGVDTSAYNARVFDEHFKGYSTVREAPVAVNALRAVDASAHVPQARVLEVLLEPHLRQPAGGYGGFGSTPPAMMQAAAAMMQAAGCFTPPSYGAVPATPASSILPTSAPPHVGADSSGSHDLLPHGHGRDRSLSSNQSWEPIDFQRVAMGGQPGQPGECGAHGCSSAPPPLSAQGSAVLVPPPQQLTTQFSGRLHPPTLHAQMSERFPQMSERAGSYHGLMQDPRELEQSTLDLALLHAAPLVWKHENHRAPLDHQSLSLDFKSEVKALWDILGRTEKQVRVRFDVASSSTLGEVLAIKPVALHLVCHADYDPYKRNAGVDVRAAVT